MKDAIKINMPLSISIKFENYVGFICPDDNVFKVGAVVYRVCTNYSKKYHETIFVCNLNLYLL